jgi:hypothetical protein
VKCVKCGKLPNLFCSIPGLYLKLTAKDSRYLMKAMRHGICIRWPKAP